ncbi:MAG: 5'-nucleotidase [gamma proteobacterium symbiont of Clathrolucina costata]
MNPPLTDDVWKRKGINILWSGELLAELSAAPKVVSLRRFFELQDAGWPEEDMPWVNDSALMVAGLDVAIDALPIEEAEGWIEQQVYTKILDFQDCFEGQMSLIFWMADHARWYETPGESAYEWYLDGKQRGQRLALGRCIWNGAQNGVRRIEAAINGKDQWVGLHHYRIS